MRYRGGDLVDLALERLVVERVERRVQRIDQEQPDHRMRRHQIDLKFDARSDHALVLEPLEVGIGSRGDVGIEQIFEMDILGRKSRLERIALAPGAARVDAKELARLAECGIAAKDRFEPGDPVAALAGFAARQPLDARTKRRADTLEHFARIRHGHAADEMNVARHRE